MYGYANKACLSAVVGICKWGALAACGVTLSGGSPKMAVVTARGMEDA